MIVGRKLKRNIFIDTDIDCQNCGCWQRVCTWNGECDNLEPMTNEEWLRTEPTTKEIVNALCEMDKWIKAKMKGEIGSYNKYEKGGYFEEWLKEKHNDSMSKV